MCVFLPGFDCKDALHSDQAIDSFRVLPRMPAHHTALHRALYAFELW